jgi:hypothetical protein
MRQTAALEPKGIGSLVQSMAFCLDGKTDGFKQELVLSKEEVKEPKSGLSHVSKRSKAVNDQ